MRSILATTTSVLLPALLSARVAEAQAVPSDAPAPLAAVQQRVFSMNNEIELSAAWLPLDPFTKTLTGEVSYTYHFTDQVAWEVFRVFYGYSIPTSLRIQAEQDFNVASGTFEQLRFGGSSSLEVAPAYGKFSMLNDTVVHAEILLAVGPMVASFSDGWKAGPIGGLGLRVFTSESISVRFDVRYGFLIGSPSALICTLSLGVSFDFGHTD
jgi:outer membrane beta-barrel protein